MKRTARHRGGFTLMELTLATLAAVIIALSLCASLNIAAKARRSVHAALDPAREINIAGDLLTRRLASVPPPNGVLAGAFVGTPRGGEAGRSDRLSFYSFDDDPPATEEDPPGGIIAVELKAEGSGPPFTLVERVRRNLLATAADPPEETVLCTRVSSFGVRYFDGTQWSDSWDSTTAGNALPVAVELAVVIAPERKGGEPTRLTRVVPLACGIVTATGSTGVLP